MQENRALLEIVEFIENLVQAGVHCRVDELESMYHRAMQVFILDSSDQVRVVDKVGFIAMFKAKFVPGGPPLNDWLKIHHVETKGDRALVLFSRKNDLSGQEVKLRLGVDLLWEDKRWQVTREIIFLESEISP
ncbi:hypothetical protein MO867_20845 [Microbulbifer sp. OS29]|uniref:SnoaL-like domain-containing protein n=1 Tax=Microbulbifer okhotskensis TaxID=2926617 RepID=A0A9X2J7N3_9GAMM|nr:hypothetical protein [Microbulbifer okhotskensis]MCO1336779.1 hypothetical protein [Microbulbifer okhotskensis]